MSSCFRRLLIISAVVGLCGCGLSRPAWLRPGSVPYQQSRANYHDPYGDSDAGPQITGGRPRAFQKPRAEPVRSSAFRDAFGAF